SSRPCVPVTPSARIPFGKHHLRADSVEQGKPNAGLAHRILTGDRRGAPKSLEVRQGGGIAPAHREGPSEQQGGSSITTCRADLRERIKHGRHAIPGSQKTSCRSKLEAGMVVGMSEAGAGEEIADAALAKQPVA